ncbi:MAG: DUF3159 domain-containing protein, partial [Pseudonocardiaceae bacterium]
MTNSVQPEPRVEESASAESDLKQPAPATPEDLAKTARDASLRAAVTDQIGGVRGMVESSLPVVVFVGVYVFTSLKVAIWAAVISAVLIAGYRLVRKDSPRHAFTGLLGVA